MALDNPEEEPKRKLPMKPVTTNRKELERRENSRRVAYVPAKDIAKPFVMQLMDEEGNAFSQDFIDHIEAGYREDALEGTLHDDDTEAASILRRSFPGTIIADWPLNKLRSAMKRALTDLGEGREQRFIKD